MILSLLDIQKWQVLMYVVPVLVTRYDYDIFILCNFEKKKQSSLLTKIFAQMCIFNFNPSRRYLLY
jgi:hypothetical protein